MTGSAHGLVARRVMYAIGAVSVGVLVAFACLAWAGFSLADLKAEQNRTKALLAQETNARVEANEQVGALTSDVRALRDQVKDAGRTPVVPAPTTEPSPGMTAEQARQIAVDAVATYGISGEAVTAIVNAAVAKVVPEQGPRGADGRDGTDGAPGADGADGSQGPGPSEEQVLAATKAAVAQYLTENPPAPGRDGKDGTDGKDGQPGEDAYPFAFTYRLPDTGPIRGQTYLCTVTDPDVTGTCEAVEEPS